MKKTVIEYKTLIHSDIHLGMRDSKAMNVSHFLKHTHRETLILNGDMIEALRIK
jgi:UDP-2,3-diacylglucosamine pyrophosphatase LpxH